MNFYPRTGNARKRFRESPQDSLAAQQVMLIYVAAPLIGDLAASASPAPPRRPHRARSARRAADNREAPACMRCRGLTRPWRAADQPIPQPFCALPGLPPYSQTRARPGPPVLALPLELPPRWPAVQVVREFLLRPAWPTQGFSITFSRFFYDPQRDGRYPPRPLLIHGISTTISTAWGYVASEGSHALFSASRAGRFPGERRAPGVGSAAQSLTPAPIYGRAGTGRRGRGRVR